MIIVETPSEISTFLYYWNNEPSLVVPVWCDLRKRPMATSLSFLYIRFRNESTDDGSMECSFVVPIDHNDCDAPVIDLSKSIQRKLVWDAKGLIQTNIGIGNYSDLHAYRFFEKNQNVQLSDSFNILTNFYNRLGLYDDLGKSIPIVKFASILRDFTSLYLDDIEHIEDSWVSDVMLPTLAKIEKRGLRVNKDKFLKKWPKYGNHLSDDIVYTEYNPFVLTSRPTNRHGGINFSSLNKSDGTREIFIPGPGKLFIQLDYDAYHVRLIASLIGFNIPSDIRGHQWLADLYGCGYDDAKLRTFRILYGGISNEDRKIGFFAETDIFIQALWADGLSNGFITTPKGRKIYLERIVNPNPQKVFNYLLQSIETEMNIDMINKLSCAGIDSLILYQYDAFLFEVPGDVLTISDTVNKIKQILEGTGFPVHGTQGTDFSKV